MNLHRFQTSFLGFFQLTAFILLSLSVILGFVFGCLLFLVTNFWNHRFQRFFLGFFQMTILIFLSLIVTLCFVFVNNNWSINSLHFTSWIRIIFLFLHQFSAIFIIFVYLSINIAEHSTSNHSTESDKFLTTTCSHLRSNSLVEVNQAN